MNPASATKAEAEDHLKITAEVRRE
ncbi:hypothetical protein NPIL_604051, partial [Nephila pilipes]